MKVLHIVPTYLPAYRYGGPIHSVHALNKYLVRGGVDVSVYTTAINGSDNLDVPISTFANLIPVDIDGVKVFYFKPGWLRSWFFSSDMRRAIQDHVADFDIVHITSVFLSASMLGARAAQKMNRPYVISPRGSLMSAPLQKKNSLKKKLYLGIVEKSNLEKADAIHFTTEVEKTEYKKLGYRLRKAILIPNGLDVESLPSGDVKNFRNKFGIAPEKRIVLFLGRLSWKKGFDTLIPAFAILSKEIPEAILLIVGGDDEGYKNKIDKLIDEYGLKEKIVYSGELTGAERSAAYASSEMFVLPSYAENFAISVAEAMYFGVPIIVTENVGLAPEVLRSGTGFVVRKDEHSVATAMIEILRDPHSARAMGDRGKIFAVEEFSYEKVAQDFEQEYNEIIKSYRANK